jgi:hypothetical protein
MKYFIIALVVLIALMTGPELFTQWRTNRQLRQKTDVSLSELDAAGLDAGNRAGHVEVRGVLQAFTVKDLYFFIGQEGAAPDQIYFWNWGGVQEATASALGIDRRHHFANSYLVGYQPFESEYVWVPLYTLTLRKRYEYDRMQYSGLQDVWQNSKQAFYYTRGDCEDHAIILADWLISMGVDARVVVGAYREQGHAWVVYFEKGRAYLLEATSKKRTRRMGAIPPASMMTAYHPTHQFNRDHFWVNTGSQFTTRYDGPQWQLRSRFVAQDPVSSNRTTSW